LGSGADAFEFAVGEAFADIGVITLEDGSEISGVKASAPMRT
jgi:hypothetical protein